MLVPFILDTFPITRGLALKNLAKTEYIHFIFILRCIYCKFKLLSGPISGSTERKRTFAGICLKWSIRYSTRLSSTLTPCHTLSGQGKWVASSNKRSERLVKIWNVCQCAFSIVMKTSWINSIGISLWKSSDKLVILIGTVALAKAMGGWLWEKLK